ncbi:MAG TPA: NAD-dependent deacylase [Longimicrobiales bacterium]|nr:NAD-dependent deacylase [Longimicrobiales bacterium]
MSGVDPGALERARGLVEGAGRIVVLTGAGVSAESGVPTFRGEDGLWKRHRPEELANPLAFRRDPRLVWEWYAWRRETVRGCEPNPGHRALARLALEREGVAIVTQNVDDLHGRAAREEAEERAPDPALPLELHGSLFRVRCTGCFERREHVEAIDATAAETLPRCPSCGALLRPDVVWFGESLDPRVIETARHRAETADLCLVVGTSAVVQPAASLPRATAAAGGAVVEVNPEETPLTSLADATLRGPAGRVLPRLLDASGPED